MKQQQSLLGVHGYAYGELTIEEQEAYKKIYEMIKKCKRISLDLAPQKSRLGLARILACIDMDHPELFWMDGYQSKIATVENTVELMQNEDVLEDAINALECGVDYDGNGKISFFERQLAAGRAALDADPLLVWSINEVLALSPVWNQWRIKNTQKRFKNYIEGCESRIGTVADDYQLFRRVFEYVASHTSYSLRKAKKAQDVRSVFVARKSVCKGYAEALQYLLLHFGIPCFTVQGIAESTSGLKGAHAWNYVMIDGVWNIVDVTAGDWDLELRPERMPNIPNCIRADFVDYRCMCVDGSFYKPADFIDYPCTGTTGSYFKREGYLLHPDAWHAYIRICNRLHAGIEKYVQVQCAGDYTATEEWMRSALALVVRICVIADRYPERAFSLNSTMVEQARSLSGDEINEAGWGDFKLNIHPISAKRDVFVLTSSC